MPETKLDEPEFTDEQLRAALRRVGDDARRVAFAGGKPVFVVRGSLLVAVYEDGTERIIESLDRGADRVGCHE